MWGTAICYRETQFFSSLLSRACMSLRLTQGNENHVKATFSTAAAPAPTRSVLNRLQEKRCVVSGADFTWPEMA